MRSPFPGIDPYLEDPRSWGGAHGRLIGVLGELLNRDLGPNFIADGDTQFYVVSPEEQRWIFPGAEPAQVRQPYILIRDRASRRVVTIVELLSPINKVPAALTGAVPPARGEFLQKRRETMASATHWLEIDLLRAGERPPAVRGLSAYYAALKRAGATDLET